MSETRTSSRPVVSPNKPPTVNIIACGGGGINMVRRALADIADCATYQYLDTSYANLSAGESAHIIGGGGSGLIRSLNADVAVKMIAAISDEDLGLADINIVVFSLSGGSGSVIGPLLISDIMARRKRLAVALTISSTQSEKHTENTLRTLQSLRKITDDARLYLPISIFNNNAGIQAVDQEMPTKLARLVDLLTKPTNEIDKADRLHWIDVQKTLGENISGLRLLYVATQNSATADTGTEIASDVSGHIYDTLLAIRTEEYEVINRPRARASFEGKFTTIKLVPMYGVIGNRPNAFTDLLKHIQSTLNDYRANSGQDEDPFGVNDGGTAGHQTGLIF